MRTGLGKSAPGRLDPLLAPFDTPPDQEVHVTHFPDNPALAKALEAIPEFVQATEALERARGLQRFEPPPETVPAVEERLRREYLAWARGETDTHPVHPGEAISQARHNTEVIQLEERIVASVVAELEQQRASAPLLGHEKAIAALGELLEQLLAEVRDLDQQLGPVSTANQANSAGPDAAAAWAQLTHAVDTYRQIREAQWWLCRKVQGSFDPQGLRDRVDRYGWLRNIEELDYDHRLALKGEVRPQLAQGTNVTNLSPQPWPEGDEYALLRWLATSDDAKPFVATWQQILDKEREMHAAIAAAAAERRGRRPRRRKSPAELLDAGPVRGEATREAFERKARYRSQ